MSFVFVFFTTFFFLACGVGPALKIENRPAFKRPDKKPRRWI